ncbi:Aldehyde/histidinol dehydrogenase [Spinellus fusiger]|nr:Aldehyde/histidinol dehydrogenase [Spinellus fusiger]
MSSDILRYTSADAIHDSFHYVQRVFHTGKTHKLEWRKKQLKLMYQMLSEHEAAICEAIAKDMGRPPVETSIYEINNVLEECLYFIEHMERLVKDQPIKMSHWVDTMSSAVIRKDPLGVVLIIASWSLPINLSFMPLVGAIAAGNSAIIKLPELSMHTSALLTELFSKYMNDECYRVVNGGQEETQLLLSYPFNHILFTGSNAVAKTVMRTAAEHLTPVTLALGGKSPVVIAEDADIRTCASSIAFGKFFNAGQTCFSPDYVLIPKVHADAFVQSIRTVLLERYTSHPIQSKDYGRIVSDKHFERVSDMLLTRESGDIVVGGEMDQDTRYIAPTIVLDVKFTDKVLMQDEIMGPVLPVIFYSTLDEAISLVNRRSSLVLYIYAKSKATVRRVIENTQSGGVCVNDCRVYPKEHSLLFGGVGTSGIGSYRGDHSFHTFSHQRTVLLYRRSMDCLQQLFYPPYFARKYSLQRMLVTTPYLFVLLKSYKRPIASVAFLLAMVTYLYKKRH